MKSYSLPRISTSALCRIAGLVLLASITAFSAKAGPGVQHWQSFIEVKTEKQAAELKDDGCAVMVCATCKDVAMYRAPAGEHHQNGSSPVAIGTQHSCSSCGGMVMIEKGKDGALAENCSKCGADSAFCCAMTDQK